jgi:2-keto-4-pentenoate hydratase
MRLMISMKLRLATCFLPLLASAAEPISQLAIEQLASDYVAKRPTSAIPSDIPMPNALVVQEKLVSRLVPHLGKPVGYKVGLVTREAQEKSGVTSPIRGVLLSSMLLTNNAEVAMDYAVKPLVEADLAVVVKDRAINRASTPLEAARSLKEVVAFIELPDSFISTNQRVTGSVLTAVNVGARLGVLGERAVVKDSAAFVDALAAMTITIVDGTGKEHGSASGSMILGNPLHAVLWLVEELQKTGKKLNPGDILSLGSVKAITPLAGQTYTVKYAGLPGGPISVSVRMK